MVARKKKAEAAPAEEAQQQGSTGWAQPAPMFDDTKQDPPGEAGTDPVSLWNSVAPVPEQPEGFTTDTASGQVPRAEPQPELTDEEQAVAGEEQAKVRQSRAKKAEAEAKSDGDDEVVNLTNMRSDLVKGVEQIERIAEEIESLKSDAKEFFGELKSKGYSVSVVRKVLARRAMDPDKRQEQDKLIALYEEALR